MIIQNADGFASAMPCFDDGKDRPPDQSGD
jgi:hypothetical protein